MTNTLYAALGGTNTTSNLYTVDPATGAMTSVGPIGFALTGLAEDPTDGTLYGLTSNNSAANPRSLISIDKTTGAGTLIAACSGGRTPWTDLAFDSSGNLYAFTQSSHLYSVNKATGAGTSIGVAGGVTVGGAISIDSTDAGYAAPNGGDNGRPLETFTVGGSFTLVANLSGSPGGNIGAFTFDSSDVLYGAINGTELITVNDATAAIASIGSFTVPGVDALCWGISPAPVTDDFSVALTPSALTIIRGNNDTTALSTTITAGVAQSITLSDTGAPTGVSLSYAANPIMSGGGTTVTVTVTGAATPGVYSIVIHAVGTEATHDASLTVTVPGPIGDAYNAFESHPFVQAAPGVMANDIDPTTVSLNTGPSHGTLTLNADGSFTYVPDPGFLGSDTWVYNGNGGTATVTITVAAATPRAVFSSDPAFQAAG